MEKSRKAFTMIELIFVIVIIGILAATALPRLAATRDDAKLSRLAQNTMIGATEIAAYAVAKGETEANLSKMSRAVEIIIRQGEGEQPDPNIPKLKIHWKGVDDCLVLRIENQGGGTETLTIEANGSTTNEGCDRLRSLIDTQRFPIPLRGQLVSY